VGDHFSDHFVQRTKKRFRLDQRLTKYSMTFMVDVSLCVNLFPLNNCCGCCSQADWMSSYCSARFLGQLKRWARTPKLRDIRTGIYYFIVYKCKHVLDIRIW